MFCINCGNKIEEGAKFCSKCGTAVNATQANEEIQEIQHDPVCLSCREKIIPGNKFCVKCGQPIEENNSKENQTINEHNLFKPTTQIWLNQIPDNNQLLDKEFLSSFRFFNTAMDLDKENQDNWSDYIQLLTNAITACPFILDYYWNRGFFLVYLSTSKVQNVSFKFLKDSPKMVIQDMTTIINAIPNAGFGLKGKTGVLYYLRGFAQMNLNRKEKEIISTDFKKSLELGIGYNGELYELFFPVLKKKTEEEHARELLYQIENGLLKSLFKNGF